VVLSNGEIVRAKHVVCCCGPQSKDFDPLQKGKDYVEVREVEYHVLNDTTGFPFAFSEFFPSQELHFGLLQGDDFKEYKIGSDERRNFTTLLPWLKVRFASKYQKFIHTHVCYYTMTEDGQF